MGDEDSDDDDVDAAVDGVASHGKVREVVGVRGLLLDQSPFS